MFNGDYVEIAEQNTNFRHVLYTGKNAQLVAMNLKPGEDIGEEVHATIDQIFFFVEGRGSASVDNQEIVITDDSVIFVPAGSKHNIVNSGNEDLKIVTVYTPPEHPDGTIHTTKEAALHHY